MNVTTKEIQFDLSDIILKLDGLFEDVEKKIEDLERRIKELYEKQQILEEFIARTQGEYEATDSRNYKLRGQLQSTIVRQLEAMQLLIDTIIKYESLVQSYNKQKMDIQNNKVNNYQKWKNIHKENADESAFIEVIKKFEEATKLATLTQGGAASDSGEDNMEKLLENSVMQETFKDGYAL